MRPELYFPTLKFHNVKSVDIATEFDARSLPYYWLKNVTNGVQAEYREGYKIVSYCDMEFSYFPFESLVCNVTYQLSGSSTNRANLKTPTVYYGYKNEEVSQIHSSLPYKIVVEPLNPWSSKELEFSYSATGITFKMKRNSLGLLQCCFYGPMAVFSILSMLSYIIPIDMVINNK